MAVTIPKDEILRRDEVAAAIKAAKVVKLVTSIARAALDHTHDMRMSSGFPSKVDS
jgi:hypothetical protein